MWCQNQEVIDAILNLEVLLTFQPENLTQRGVSDDAVGPELNHNPTCTWKRSKYFRLPNNSLHPHHDIKTLGSSCSLFGKVITTPLFQRLTSPGYFFPSLPLFQPSSTTDLLAQAPYFPKWCRVYWQRSVFFSDFANTSDVRMRYISDAHARMGVILKETCRLKATSDWAMSVMSLTFGKELRGETRNSLQRKQIRLRKYENCFLVADN